MADLRINRAKLRYHLHYSGWKYAVAAVACLGLVSLLFDVTRYVPPREKTVSFYVTTGFAQQDALRETLWPEIAERFPEQEALTVIRMNLEEGDMYSRMQYTTYLGAGEGDLLLVSRAEYGRLAGTGAETEAFCDLSPYAEEGLLRLAEGERFSVSAEGLTGLSDYGCGTEDAVLCVLSGSRNPRTAAGLIGILQARFSAP